VGAAACSSSVGTEVHGAWPEMGNV
jgi:hypothetical protein